MKVKSVTLIGPDPRDNCVGIRSYADSLGAALKKKGLDVKTHFYKKRDLWIAGRNVGAVAFPMLSRLRFPPKSDVTHAAFSNFTSAACDVVTVMDLVWQKPGYAEAKILNNLYKLKMKKSVVICPTDFVAEQVSRWLKVPRSSIFTTHLGVDNDFREHSSLRRFRPTALLVGDANERKRTVEAIKALEGLDVDVIHVGKRLVTNPYGIECVSEAAKRGVRLEDLGPVSKQRLVDLYNEAHFLLYPSSDEGFGLPPLEAAACGTPAVVGSHPVFAEVMGQDCVPCDGTNPQSIREAVRSCIAAPPSSRNLLARASRFSWSRCADETLKAYEAAL